MATGCYNCKYWHTNTEISNEHGEGCGKCGFFGEITFCDHSCLEHKSTQSSESIMLYDTNWDD